MLARSKHFFVKTMGLILLSLGAYTALGEGGSAPPHEIKGIYTSPTLVPLWLVALAIVFFLILVMLIFYFWKKKSRLKGLNTPLPATPQEIYSELKNFAPNKEGFSAYEGQKIYFLRLNHLMRSFIAGLSQLKAEALTGDELRATPIPQKFIPWKKSWDTVVQGFSSTEMVIFGGLSLEFSAGEAIYQNFLIFAKNVLDAEEAAQKNFEVKDSAGKAKLKDATP